MKMNYCYWALLLLNLYVCIPRGAGQNNQNVGVQPVIRSNGPNANINNQKTVNQKSINNSPFVPIADSQECRDDVRRICSAKKYNANNNFEILVCLVNNQNNEEISDECHQFLWQYKYNATKSTKFGKIAQDLCKQTTSEVPQCEEFMHKPDGKLISCLIEHKSLISSPGCISFITKIQTVIFSDFHLICNFVEECNTDITKHHCGKLGANDRTNSQGQVVSCLQDHLIKDKNSLTASCQKQIIRISELSSEDYHLDRFLYFRCKQDRETFCADIPAGQGRIYDCLYKHKFEKHMSLKCREALTKRQEIEVINYNSSYSLVHKCKAEIKTRNCNKNLPSNDENKKTEMISLTSVLLCLEDPKFQKPLSNPCEEELFLFRQMLMEDYQLSPEIVLECKSEIDNECKPTLDKPGMTIHCLMGLTQRKEGLKKSCEQAIMTLLKETSPLSDFRLDPLLTAACQTFINSKCNNQDDGETLSCLMDHRRDATMKKSCKKALFELEYFVSRDFTLDPKFRKACNDDAIKHCGELMAGNGAGNGEGIESDSLSIDMNIVLHCLYTRIHVKPGTVEDAEPLKVECAEAVHTVLEQRALDLDLNPLLEKNCRLDLGQYCSETTLGQGTEFICLQDHLDDLSPPCKNSVKELTKMEAQNVLDFDNILIQECEPMLKKYCHDLIDQEDDGKIMQCLIDNKENMESTKCAAGVTHFQLIEMKDYNLNPKFHKHCSKDIHKLCKDKTNKGDVVACLSENIRNTVLSDGTDNTPKVSKECKEQLTVEKLQMHKSFDLNPLLKKYCGGDYHTWCSNKRSGKAEVIECLREHKKNLTAFCRKHLFNFEVDESLHPEMDFKLMRTCKSDILQRCTDNIKSGDPQLVYECLIKHKSQLLEKCRKIVNEREKEMFSDIELNVDLKRSCSDDIERYCRDEKDEAAKKHKSGEDPNGIVYECLSNIFIRHQSKKKSLSENCYNHLKFVLHEQELDYSLNPQIVLKCVAPIEIHCSSEQNPKDIMSCLKNAFLLNRLNIHKECMLEIAKVIQEGESDIMADPVLHDACALDLQANCAAVPEGHGRKITCLVNAANHGGVSADCSEILEKRRKMWENANRLREVSGLGDVYRVVINSDSSSYLLSMFVMIFFLILVSGTLCGRMTKRVSGDRKTR